MVKVGFWINDPSKRGCFNKGYCLRREPTSSPCCHFCMILQPNMQDLVSAETSQITETAPNCGLLCRILQSSLQDLAFVEADPERPQTIYSRNTFYEAELGKFNRTLYYCKLWQYFVCPGNDKCKKNNECIRVFVCECQLSVQINNLHRQ